MDPERYYLDSIVDLVNLQKENKINIFPDILPALDGNKAVSGSEAYKIIGNAVPPLLWYHIAKRLEENWSLYFGEDKK